MLVRMLGMRLARHGAPPFNGWLGPKHGPTGVKRATDALPVLIGCTRSKIIEAELLQHLERLLRAYVEAVAREDLVEQRQHARVLCQALARLLAQHLETTGEWSRYAWIDDLEDLSITMTSDTSLEVQGYISWDAGRHDHGQWIDPFKAELRWTSEWARVDYQLAFGDKRNGIGWIGYSLREKARAKADPARVDEWLWVFRQED